jgi:hypothetical protein
MIYRAVFLIFVFALSALADDQEFFWPQTRIKVRVTVSAPDSMKREARSFLTRELRALGDVEVVDTVAYSDYHIHRHIRVVAVETKSRGSTVPTGYAVSAIVTVPLNLITLKTILPGFDDAKLKAAKETTACHELIFGHYLRIGPPDGLAELCESLIAEIDGEEFEGVRKSNRELKQAADEEFKKEQ